MRKVFLLATFLLALTSCNEKLPEPNKSAVVSSTIYGPERDFYTIIKIDGCEYIRWTSSYSGTVLGLVHKGNCSNHK